MPEFARRRAALASLVGRHPRLWGTLFMVAMLAAYIGLVRPARLWTAEHVALPLFESIETPRAAQYVVARAPERPDAVYAIPRARADGRDPRQLAREGGTAEWSAPVGVLFVLPAMFLVFVFPTRPFWLVLLGYHLIVGLPQWGVKASLNVSVAFGIAAYGLVGRWRGGR